MRIAVLGFADQSENIVFDESRFSIDKNELGAIVIKGYSMEQEDFIEVEIYGNAQFTIIRSNDPDYDDE